MRFSAKTTLDALKRVISRQKRVLCTQSLLTQWKHWEWCKCIELCKTRLTNAKRSVSLRLNAFFSKNDVRCAKTRYFALKRVLCTLSVLTQWKHWEWCKCIDLCKTRLTNAKTSVFLRLNAFLSKNDVRCAKTRYFALKTRFMHTIGFNAMKALGMVQMHWFMQNQAN